MKVLGVVDRKNGGRYNMLSELKTHLQLTNDDVRLDVLTAAEV